MDTCRLFIGCLKWAKRRRFEVVKIPSGLSQTKRSAWIEIFWNFEVVHCNFLNFGT
jgi:hypothetical protein